MKNRFKHSINYIAVLIGMTSFALGAICLLLFKTSSDTGLFAIGYLFTLLAAMANVIMLLLVLINAIQKIKDYQEHFMTIFLMFLNIPIVLLYHEIL